MLKKITIFTLILTMVFSMFGFASAGSPDYTAVPSATKVSCGEKVTFDITTPSSVQKIKVYVDKSYNCKADKTSSAGDNIKWTVSLSFNKSGDRKINFKAYSSGGKLLKSFPDSPIVITVKYLPPVTEKPIILDCDRTVLLGTPPSNGVKLKKYGFNMGISPDSLSTNVKSNDLVRGEMNKLVTGLTPETTYYYQAYVVTSKGTFTGDVVSFITPAKKEWTAEEVASITNSEDRYKFLFGTDTRFYKWKDKPYGFATKAEAQMQTVNIDVPVWKLKGSKKVSGTMSLTVNYKLEESVKAIFQDIYNLDIKFPIISLKGYWYRRASGPGITGKGMMSHHSFGAAIDVNKKYNLFYRYKDKRNKKSPYYTPQAVIDVFAKYGWSWGGNFAEGYDTMHFQYLGLDLLGK